LFGDEQIDTLVGEASALMMLLRSGDLSHLLQEMSGSNIVAAMLSSELTAHAHVRAAAAHDSSAERINHGAVAPMSRPMALGANTQEEMDKLVEETGALMARMGSTDAEKIQSTLQDMSSRNSLSALLASRFELPSNAPSQTQVEKSAIPQNCLHDDAQQHDTAIRLSQLKQSVSVTTQDDLDALIEDTGMLLGQLLTTDAASLSDMLVELSSESVLAGILCETLVSDTVDMDVRGDTTGSHTPSPAKKSEVGSYEIVGSGISRVDSLQVMFQALKGEGLLVETRLGRDGSFRVDSHNSPPQPASSAASSLSRQMMELRDQAAQVSQVISSDGSKMSPVTTPLKYPIVLEIPQNLAVSLNHILDIPCSMHPDLSPKRGPMVKRWKSLTHVASASDDTQRYEEAVSHNDDPQQHEKAASHEDSRSEPDLFTVCEYESSDDGSDDDDDNEQVTHMRRTRKRDILLRGLKVLHMSTLNMQSDFLFLWSSARHAHDPEPTQSAQDEHSGGGNDEDKGRENQQAATICPGQDGVATCSAEDPHLRGTVQGNEGGGGAADAPASPIVVDGAVVHGESSAGDKECYTNEAGISEKEPYMPAGQAPCICETEACVLLDWVQVLVHEDAGTAASEAPTVGRVLLDLRHAAMSLSDTTEAAAHEESVETRASQEEGGGGGKHPSIGGEKEVFCNKK